MAGAPRRDPLARGYQIDMVPDRLEHKAKCLLTACLGAADVGYRLEGRDVLVECAGGGQIRVRVSSSGEQPLDGVLVSPAAITSKVPAEAAAAFHLVTEAAGHGKPVVVDRGAPYSRLTPDGRVSTHIYGDDHDLVVLRHRDLRVVPDAPAAVYDRFRSVIRTTAKFFLCHNRDECARQQWGLEDLTSFAMVWTTIFWGTARLLEEPAGNENEKLLYSYLRQRFAQLYQQMRTLRSRNLPVDHQTLAIGANVDFVRTRSGEEGAVEVLAVRPEQALDRRSVEASLRALDHWKPLSLLADVVGWSSRLGSRDERVLVAAEMRRAARDLRARGTDDPVAIVEVERLGAELRGLRKAARGLRAEAKRLAAASVPAEVHKLRQEAHRLYQRGKRRGEEAPLAQAKVKRAEAAAIRAAAPPDPRVQEALREARALKLAAEGVSVKVVSADRALRAAVGELRRRATQLLGASTRAAAKVVMERFEATVRRRVGVVSPEVTAVALEFRGEFAAIPAAAYQEARWRARARLQALLETKCEDEATAAWRESRTKIDLQDRERSAAALLEEGLSSLPHDSLVEILGTYASQQAGCPETRQEAARRLRAHEAACRTCSAPAGTTAPTGGVVAVG